MAASESPLAPPHDTAYAWQLLHLRRPAQALELTARLLAANPTDLDTLLARVEALRQLGRLDEAAEVARTAVAQAPQSDQAFAALAKAYGQQGQLYKAEKAISEALRLDPLHAGYYGLLAQLHYLQNHSAAAVASAESGLRVHARHPDCLLWRAVATEKLERPAATDTDFGLLLRLAPTSALVHLWRGRLLLRRYEPHAANTHLSEALRLAPTTSAEVVPLLRQARRRQHWPRWLLHLHQQRRHSWERGAPFSWQGPVAALATPLYWGRAWWRTRHDPVVQQPLPGERRAMVRQGLLLTFLGILIVGLTYCVIAFELPPYLFIVPVIAFVRALADKRPAR